MSDDRPRGDDALHPGRFAWALLLLALAGAVDAVGFVHLNGLFVSFMSGNTTQVAVLAGGGHWHAFGRIGAVILAFVLGVAGGELATGDPPRRAGFTLLVEAALLGVAAHGGAATGILLAFAMGMHNALVLRAERVGLALTYVTGTLVHLGRALAAWLGRRPDAKPGWPYAAMWLALATGAVLGGIGARLGEARALSTLAAMLATIGLAATITRAWRQER